VRALLTKPAVSCLALAAAGSAAWAASATSVASTTTTHAVNPWPYDTLQLGITSSPTQAQAQRRQAPFGFRYQYLAGGVNTGQSTWLHWGDRFVATYIKQSEAVHEVPVFSYYELRQSQPGSSQEQDSAADLINLRDPRTMRAYYANLKAFFEQAVAARGPVVLHVEPDLWGYIEQAARGRPASSVAASVASSGMPNLRGLPNNAVGFAHAVIALRDRYAPHVILAYADSIWGTGLAIQASHPSSAQVRAMAAWSVAFYRSLHARFDALFTETSDRDAGYAQVVNGAGRSAWWRPVDFRHLGQYIGAVHRALGLPVTVWQIPVGNTLFRVQNNTPYHYQDDTVQTLMGSGAAARALLRRYARAGVAALLFGGGQPTDTCACRTGTAAPTEPTPIDGNTRRSLDGDDDGGYFMAQAARYYRLRPLRTARSAASSGR
jgi:hypothetical protein